MLGGIHDPMVSVWGLDGKAVRWMDCKYEQKVGSGGRQKEDKEGEQQTRQN